MRIVGLPGAQRGVLEPKPTGAARRTQSGTELAWG